MIKSIKYTDFFINIYLYILWSFNVSAVDWILNDFVYDYFKFLFVCVQVKLLLFLHNYQDMCTIIISKITISAISVFDFEAGRAFQLTFTVPAIMILFFLLLL